MEKQLAWQVEALSRFDDLRIHVAATPELAPLFDANQFTALPMERSRNNPALLTAMHRCIRETNPDIIHTHGHKAATLIKRLKGLLGKRKLVASVHGTKKRNRFLEKFDQVLAVSQGVSDALLPISSSVLHNAVPEFHGIPLTKAELCQQFELNDKQPLLLAIGRLAPVKRYDVLMQAVQNTAFNLLVIGEGPERERLEPLQTEHIKLAGHRDDVRALIPAADFVVISSEREGLSLTMIETLMAHGSILSTPVSGAREMLPPCCLLHSNDAKSLAQELGEKWSQRSLIHNALTPVHARSHEQFSLETLAGRLRAHYHALLPQSDTIENRASE